MDEWMSAIPMPCIHRRVAFAPMTDSDCAHLLCLVNPGDPFDLSLERPIGWPVQFGEALSGVVGPVWGNEIDSKVLCVCV